MKTDRELYRLFAARPDYLFACAGIKIFGTCEMKSVTFKEFERRSDGLPEPISDSDPVYLAEFQAYADNTKSPFHLCSACPHVRGEGVRTESPGH